MSFVKMVRLVVPAGAAKPSPAIGQALGQLGINMMAFCKEFNAQTGGWKQNIPLRVKLSAFSDQTFKFTVGSPATTYLLKKAAGIEKGANNPGKEVVGSVHAKQIYEIARIKQQDSPLLQKTPLDSVARSVVATMNSMGLKVDTTRGVNQA